MGTPQGRWVLLATVVLTAGGSAPASQRVIDLAKEAGVGRVVRLSAMGVEASDNPMRRVEQHLERSGLEYTLLRPNWFMQNYSTTNAASIRAPRSPSC